MLKLRDYQEEAVKFALKTKFCLWLMNVGSGKTICSMFLSRLILNKNIGDKVIIACTVSSTNPFLKDYLRKAKVSLELVEDVDKFISFLSSDEKILIIKHSMLEKLGVNQNYIDIIENKLSEDFKKLTLIVDEAHEFNNHEGIGHAAFQNLRFMWDRIVLLTATPYSSKLEQLYGLICLIYPKLWKNVREFKNLFIVEKVVKDWKTGKFLRSEPIEYVNLPLLREILETFTFFYYPPVPLNYIEHKVRLKDYGPYDELCSKVFTDTVGDKKGKDDGEED